MTLFQMLVIPVLSLLALAELRSALALRMRLASLVRFGLWSAAALAIARPDWTVALATPLGIQRGSDLVMYFFMLASLGTTLYFYARQERLTLRMNLLIRELALRDAQPGAIAIDRESPR